MKLEDIPQDPSALANFTRELCYAKDADGKYGANLSTGWNVKKEALDAAWSELNQESEAARNLVVSGKQSPIYYFMTVRLMDTKILSGYTGFWCMTIRRHFKPSVFDKLSDSKLKRYADAFQISLDELKNFGK